MENITLENLAVVLKFYAYIGVTAGGCGLFAILAMRWWKTDKKHREEMAPIKARVLRRQREAEKKKTDK